MVPLTNTQRVVYVQPNKSGGREKALNIQRIQLAEELSDKHKLCTALEARISTLQYEITSIKSNNEALQSECAGVHRQIDIKSQQLEAQAINSEQRDRAMLERIRDLESKLEEADKSLKPQERDIEEKEQAMKEAFGELDDAKISISRMETSNEARQRDLQQHLALKGTEVENLREQINKL